MSEIWRAIPGFDGAYDVSDQGRVRSLDRLVTSEIATRGYPKRMRGRVLKPQRHSGGYLQVSLGDKNMRLVHWLVLEAFVGPRPSGAVGRHRDDDKTNNALTNLCYGTPKQNTQDMVSRGRSAFGRRNGQARLTEAEVAEIRCRCTGGEYQRDVAADFGVAQGHVSRLVRRKQWRHVA